MSLLNERLRALSPEVLVAMRRGIEKEGLRVRADASLADTPHPAALGSALTHPHITTDFSESQLELITGIHTDADSCLRQLTQIHQIVYRHLGDELLWNASMPCRLPQSDEAIPLGRYGSSNVGTAKTVYRRGLSYRYGRRMQTISGIHYNFSLPDAAWPMLQRADAHAGDVHAYRNSAYFALIRNFRRHSWLLLYLFGASPALCRSFVEGRPHPLQPLEADTMYLPHATSLRMGPLGYQSDAQASLAVSYNSLASYASSLNRALTEPYPPYEAIGLRDASGQYRQLSTTLLQIENEFYGTIRPKRRVKPGERPLRALGERGVEYVEVRCLDVDPFFPVGIDQTTLHFLDVFLLHCLLAQSPDDTPEEIAQMSRNQHRVALRGREPQLQLQRGDQSLTLTQWGSELVDALSPIADALDAARGGSRHRDAVVAARAALAEPSAAPSARVLQAMARDHRNSYAEFALAWSVRHRDALRALALDPQVERRFEELAADSISAQRQIEAADGMTFEAYRHKYLSQDLMSGDQLQPQADAAR